MQNRYVGDIGDFGKYALLRALTGLYTAPRSARQLRLGVAWFLYPDESHNADGKYTGYLNPTHSNRTKFRACDPQLYDVLQSVVDTGNRNISAIQENRILPGDTVFHDSSLAYPRGMSRPTRQATREEWLADALQATANADLVFVDPDNGVSATADPLRKTGAKYVFLDDLSRFAQRGQSLVIYHHLSRQGTAEQQVKRVSDYLQFGLEFAELPIALRYRRGTARAYFLIAQPAHKLAIDKNLSSFLHSPWQQHFQLAS